MIVPLLQIALVAAVASHLIYWRVSASRRNARSWDSLLARLKPHWSLRDFGDGFAWNEEHNGVPEEKWKHVNGVRGLCEIFENASVMLEMADYAARNSDSVDRELLNALRRDAMLLRVRVLVTLARYAVSEVNENICMNASLAEQAYARMTLRMTEFLGASAADILPEFVAAM